MSNVYPLPNDYNNKIYTIRIVEDANEISRAGRIAMERMRSGDNLINALTFSNNPNSFVVKMGFELEEVVHKDTHVYITTDRIGIDLDRTPKLVKRFFNWLRG